MSEAQSAAVTAQEKLISDIKAVIADAEAALFDKTRAAAQATDAFVHESPWQAVGIGAGVGFLLGLILGRR
ncbi:MAG: hypothetical protein RLZ81_421 [Pseudomonadota bacterium]|jgi:ElaB/YqjD/DUF883 family membrane-anchored ribosome-binding protein